MNQSITIVRQYRGVGIDNKLNGFDMANEKPLNRKVYHGRLVYLLNGKQIGLPSVKKDKNKCNIKINNYSPF